MISLADAWLHNLDPFAIEFSGFLGDHLNGGIRWYGLSYLAGFILGFFLIKRVLKAGVSPLKPDQAADLVLHIAIGIVVGGRLGYMIFYSPDLLIRFDASFPFWGALQLNRGGMASHGGILGGAAGCLVFAYRTGAPTMHLFDLMAFGGPLGLLMGRIANFINGELIGRACPKDFPLAVQFPQEIAMTWTPDQLDNLRETFSLRDDTSARTLSDLAAQQVQAGDPQWIAYLSDTLTTRYPSQLFAGVTEGIVVFLVVLFIYRKPVKAGIGAGWFCVIYASMRIFNELFRRPDAQFIDQGQLPDITRGQWLSIALLAIGVITLIYAHKSQAPKLGGWRRVSRDKQAIAEHAKT